MRRNVRAAPAPPEFPLPRNPRQPTQPPPPPSRGVRAATFRLLLDTAMDLIQQDGHIPSIAEVAVRCHVSRATAYRYFPSRSALITSVVDASLGSVRNAPPVQGEDAHERVQHVFKATFPRFQQFEPQLRAALQLALEQWALQRAGLLEEEPYRRGHRVAILAGALAPLKGQLAPAVRDRLHRALSVLYGIEAYTILKDMWDVSEKEIERTVLWMADALIEASVREGKKK